jgi:hypothetical protein
MAKFVPYKSAASTRSATVMAQMRRQYGRMALLRHNWHFAATIREQAADVTTTFVSYSSSENTNCEYKRLNTRIVPYQTMLTYQASLT